eukprot:m.123123 g.123123  ORF g.123123 m.123123 type:complete len:287 (-) comp9401_c1_seq3:1751-2611(-)
MGFSSSLLLLRRGGKGVVSRHVSASSFFSTSSASLFSTSSTSSSTSPTCLCDDGVFHVTGFSSLVVLSATKFWNLCGNFCFTTSINSIEQISPQRNKTLTEVVFMGSSNVGKSTLINGLCNQKIAKTSKTAGHTRMLNVFDSANSTIRFVDVPGYGHRVKEDQMNLLGAFLEDRINSGNSIITVLLVDSRKGLTDTDVDALYLLQKLKVPVQVVLTKCDKLSPVDVIQQLKESEHMLRDIEGHLRKKYFIGNLSIQPISAKTRDGLVDLKCILWEAHSAFAKDKLS